MPYIDSQRREDVDPTQAYRLDSPQTTGELNYSFSVLAKEYMSLKGLSYQTINDVIGALEGAKMEFYRRIAVPYEEEKREINGDVYT